MYTVNTLSALNSAVNRDEPEIRIEGDALHEYEIFTHSTYAANVIGNGLLATPIAIGVGILTGPVGATVALGAGIAKGILGGKRDNDRKDEKLSQKACDNLRTKISTYYKKTGSGNSYVIIKHR